MQEKHLNALKILTLAAIFLCSLNSISHAQKPQLEDMRFTRLMVPVDSVTLKSEGLEINLWGIQPAGSSETHLELRALNLLQHMINDQDVTCKIMTAEDVTHPSARCSTSDGDDLSLKLLQQGLAIRDRRALYGSVFASSYQEAEELARRNKNGIWKLVDTDDKSLVDRILDNDKNLMMTAIGFILLPFLAMLILGFIIVRSISRLEKYQSSQATSHYTKERGLYQQEKNLILKNLEAELKENKSRVEAFLTVYMEMLSNIKDPEVTPQYQKSGDIVSLQPNFAHDIFEEHINTLSSLDMKLSAELNRFYKMLGSDPDYIDLDPSTPREEAISIVDKIVSEAREYLPLFDQMLDKIHAHMRHITD